MPLGVLFMVFDFSSTNRNAIQQGNYGFVEFEDRRDADDAVKVRFFIISFL